MAANIFISYSRRDSALVTPVVALLRASENFVYLDKDSIRPGKKWRDELDAAIASADKLVLFWCGHSQVSPEVENEIAAALNRGKDILPLLLDGTSLPPALAEYQHIDFRAAFEGVHSEQVVLSTTATVSSRSYPGSVMNDPASYPAPSRRRGGGLFRAVLFGLLLAIAGATFWFWTRSHSGAGTGSTWILSILAWLTVAVVGLWGLAAVVRIFRRARQPVPDRMPAPSHPPNYQADRPLKTMTAEEGRAVVRAVAGRIEQELLRTRGGESE